MLRTMQPLVRFSCDIRRGAGDFMVGVGLNACLEAESSRVVSSERLRKARNQFEGAQSG